MNEKPKDRFRFPLRYPQEWYEALVWERDRQEASRRGPGGPELSMNQALCNVLEKHVVRRYEKATDEQESL